MWLLQGLCGPQWKVTMMYTHEQPCTHTSRNCHIHVDPITATFHSISTYRQFISCIPCFICRNFKPSKILSSISYPASLFILAMGFLNRGGFIIHTLLQETSKSCTLSLFLPGTCIQPFTLFCRAHNDIRMHISYGQVCLTYLLVGRTWAGWGSTCGSRGHSHRRTAADPAWEKQMQIFS